MAGTVAVLAEKPPLRRAGRLDVVVDGLKVGQVGQGQVAEFDVEPGPHTLRVGAGGSRSNTLELTVVEGATSRFVSYSTGIGPAVAFLPILGVVLAAFPGTLFRLRPHVPAPVAPAAREQPRAPQDRQGEGGSGTGSGLWWESDPVLAKRLRKTGTDGTR